MSSIMTHLCIAKEVANKMNFSYEYIKGSILPDLSKNLEGNTRDKTHYITNTENEVLKVPNINKFLKYNKLNNEENMGIYSHLIEDKIYFGEFVTSYIDTIDNDKNKIIFKFENDKKIHTFKEFQKIFYLDFAYLNNYLIKKFDLDIMKIQEELVKITNNENLKQYIKENVKYYEPLNYKPIVFTEKEAINYIEKSIQVLENEFSNIIH